MSVRSLGQTHKPPNKKEYRVLGDRFPVVLLLAQNTRVLRVYRETTRLLFAWDYLLSERKIFWKTTKAIQFSAKPKSFRRCFVAYESDDKTIHYQTDKPDDEEITEIKNWLKRAWLDEFQVRANIEWSDKLTKDYQNWKKLIDKAKKAGQKLEEEDVIFKLDLPIVKLTATAEKAINEATISETLGACANLLFDDEVILQAGLASIKPRDWKTWLPFMLAGVGLGCSLTFIVMAIFPTIMETFGW